MKPYVKPCGDGAIGKFLMQWCELAYLIGSAPHPAYILHDSCGLLACHARLRAFPPQAVFGPCFSTGLRDRPLPLFAFVFFRAGRRTRPARKKTDVGGHPINPA
jgi:hypothetical protein